jgi:hypothetical protein
MLELEALILSIEPVAALAVGVGAVLLAPLADALGETAKNDDRLNNLGNSLADSARETSKNVMVWGIEMMEGAQSAFAEVQESFNDLVAEAQAEHQVKKQQPHQNSEAPRPIDITAEE